MSGASVLPKGVAMKKQALNYSQHYETLVALVTYLAICEINDNAQQRRDNATTEELAKYIGLETEEIKMVLNGFKGLFRRSIVEHPIDKKYEKQYRYTLQLRYARRIYTDDPMPAEWGSPLSNEDLFTLLSFITNKVREEQENERQIRANHVMMLREEKESERQIKANRITMIGIWAVATMSLLSIIVQLIIAQL